MTEYIDDAEKAEERREEAADQLLSEMQELIIERSENGPEQQTIQDTWQNFGRDDIIEAMATVAIINGQVRAVAGQVEDVDEEQEEVIEGINQDAITIIQYLSGFGAWLEGMTDIDE